MFHSYFTSVSPCVNKCPCRTHGHSDCRCALGRFVAHGGFTDEGALTPRYSQANMWEFSVSVCAAGEANCEPCGLGFSLLGWNGTETTCQPCKSGTYKPISSATCVPCYPGTFGTAVGYAGSYECAGAFLQVDWSTEYTHLGIRVLGRTIFRKSGIPTGLACDFLRAKGQRTAW